MQTQCPDCATVFRVSSEQLAAAEGLVRCGECGNVFNASAALLETPVPDPGAPPGNADGGQEPLDLTFTPDQGRASARFFLQDVIQGSEPDRRARRGLWRPLNAVLALALAGQLIYHYRDALAYLPGARPLLSAMCETAGCTLAPHRDLDNIALLDRNVYSHPNAAGALIISATMVNNAGFTQRYPLLAVSMANVRGTTIAQRDFAPEDYLPLADVAAGMAPGAPVSIALQVVDPGSDAMTFELDFY